MRKIGDVVTEGYLDIVQKELQINSHDLFGFFPESFYADEILFFSVAPTFFFGERADVPKNQLICINALQMYVSIKVHILAQKSMPAAHPHALELAVLFGDYLSGRFAERTVAEGEIALYYNWLDYSQSAYEELTALSLRGIPQENRHRYHVSALMKKLLSLAEKDVEQEALDLLTQAFLTGKWDAYKQVDAGFRIGHPDAIDQLCSLSLADAHKTVASFEELKGIHTIWVNL